uniref:Uncharacterized protein n=1 Tax=Heterorhabditis bacteriophora TaxID=37862 RepID=A0A1I7WF42_HETBA
MCYLEDLFKKIILTKLICRNIEKFRLTYMPTYILVSLQIFRSLKRKLIILFLNFVILFAALGFCYRYIYKRSLPTCTLYSHSCGIPRVLSVIG